MQTKIKTLKNNYVIYSYKDLNIISNKEYITKKIKQNKNMFQILQAGRQHAYIITKKDRSKFPKSLDEFMQILIDNNIKELDLHNGHMYSCSAEDAWMIGDLLK